MFTNLNFLGLILDANLNWKKHLGKISNQCSKKIGILNKLKHTLPQEIQIILYNSLILPHINSVLWLGVFIQTEYWNFKKKASRIITLSKYNSHSEPLYKKLDFLKVDDIFKLQQLTFYYKYLHDNLPAYLQNWKLIPNDNVHTHDTRIKNELYTFRAKHEFAKKCLRHNLPLIVNN